MNYITYVKAELMILVPILYGIGIWIKAIPKIKDYWIPFILLSVSIPLTLFYLIGRAEFIVTGNLIVTGVFQGMLLALTTVGGNQLYKQYRESSKDKEGKS